MNIVNHCDSSNRDASADWILRRIYVPVLNAFYPYHHIELSIVELPTVDWKEEEKKSQAQMLH